MEPGFKLTLVTPPDVMPVTLDQVKSLGRIYSDDFDDTLNDNIDHATRYAEAFLGAALVNRTYKGSLDFWPRHHRRHHHRRLVGALDLAWFGGLPVFGMARRVELPRPPLVSVASITTYDDSDVATVMDPSRYYVDTAAFVGEIVLRNNQIWDIPTRGANGIEIVFTAGYGEDPTLVPGPWRTAIKQLAVHLWLHPEAIYGLDGRANPTEMPHGILDALRAERVWNL